MKIAYLTSQYGRPSDTFVRGEVEELRKLGHEVSTFSVRRPRWSENAGPEVRKAQQTTCYLLELGAMRLLLAMFREALTRPARLISATRLLRKTMPAGLTGVKHIVYLMEACALSQRLRMRGVQVLHNHIAENSADVAMLASRLSGVPWTHTVHGPGIFYRPERWSLSLKAHHAATTVCISSFCRSQVMVFTGPQDWKRLQIVRCGVDLEMFQSEDNHEFLYDFLFVGRLCSEKAPLLLIEAATKLAESYRETRVAVVGDGEQRDLVERVARDNGLTSVELLGYRSSEDVRDLMRKSRVFVLPSFAEGLPVVIMEAMAMGRPVISTAIAGIPELVKDGENGWLVPAGDVQALTEAMREAMETPVERLTEMGRAGRAAVVERHDIRKEVAKLASLFEASVAESRAAERRTSRRDGGDVASDALAESAAR